MDAPWTFAYADGSANGYRLSQASTTDDVRFEYDPVTPAQSSTGHYSGGPPRHETLRPDDPRLTELWRRVADLEADTAHHEAHRNKGSGAFTLTTPAGTRRFLYARVPALLELDALMARFGS